MVDEGDRLEYSLSAEHVMPDGRGAWFKFGGVTTVRPGEEADEARERLILFVHEGLNEAIEVATE